MPINPGRFYGTRTTYIASASANHTLTHATLHPQSIQHPPTVLSFHGSYGKTFKHLYKRMPGEREKNILFLNFFLTLKLFQDTNGSPEEL
jgi:hypothetical protein